MAHVMSGLHNSLKELRKVKGLTQADLASAAGVSRKTINTIENKVFVPSTVLALTLSKVLDVSVHDIFELEE
jgi:putative transcriptional regulator